MPLNSTKKPADSDALPPGLTVYKRSPVFDQDTIPAALCECHRTKPGVWGVIRILEGRLLYRTFAPDRERVLDPTSPAIVRPSEPHLVKPIDKVRFLVEFCKVTSP